MSYFYNLRPLEIIINQVNAIRKIFSKVYISTQIPIRIKIPFVFVSSPIFTNLPKCFQLLLKLGDVKKGCGRLCNMTKNGILETTNVLELYPEKPCGYKGPMLHQNRRPSLIVNSKSLNI